MRPVYKVAVTIDNRYTRREGIYPDNEKHTSLETTYLIPHPVLDKGAASFYKKSTIQQPVQKMLTIPSTSLLHWQQQYIGNNNINNNVHNGRLMYSVHSTGCFGIYLYSFIQYARSSY